MSPCLAKVQVTHPEVMIGEPIRICKRFQCLKLFEFVSGSISITHHIVSPLSRGLFKSAVKANSLFRRGICQSGTCFYPGAYFSPEQSRKFLLKRLPAMGKAWNLTLMIFLEKYWHH